MPLRNGRIGDGENPRAVPTGKLHSRRGHRRGNRHREMRLRIRLEVQTRLVERKPVRLIGDRLRLGQQPHDDVEGLAHAVALSERVDAKHVGVGYQSARPDAEHHAPPREVVEQRHPVRNHQGMMVRQADDAGAELDMLRPLRRDAHEHLRRGDGLPSRRVVFADPSLVESQVVEPLDKLEVALQAECGVLAQQVERRQKDAELHTVGKSHRVSCLK